MADEWFDVLTDRPLSAGALVAALADLLDIPPAEIVILEGSYSEIPGHPTLVCHTFAVEGEFVQALALFGPRATAPEPDAFTRALAARFDCRVLFDDPSEPQNPFAWRVIAPDGLIRRVYLDGSAMAREPEHYVVARYRD